MKPSNEMDFVEIERDGICIGDSNVVSCTRTKDSRIDPIKRVSYKNVHIPDSVERQERIQTIKARVQTELRSQRKGN